MKLLKYTFPTFAIFAFFAVINSVSSETRELVKGSDYEQMGPKGTTKPEVFEFFNYGCPACYQMESFVGQFKAKHKDTKFTLVPVGLNPSWKIYVKAYYLGSLLKVTDKSHPAIFHLIHVEKKILKNDSELKSFFVNLGVDGDKFDKANKSFALNANIRKSKQLARKYQISGIPMFVANKKYKLNNQALGTSEMIEYALEELTKVDL